MDMRLVWRRKLILILIIAGVVWSSLVLFSDWKHLAVSLRQISMKRMLLVLGLSSVNYWIRLARFNWLTKRVAVAPIKKDLNSVIFFSGLSMNLTPARVGEVVKAFYQQKFFGESAARMAPIVLAERLADSLAMLVMIGVGSSRFRMGEGMFAVLLTVVGLIVFTLHRRSLGRRIMEILEMFPRGRKLAEPFSRLLTSSYKLTGWQPMAVGTLMGVMAWVAEAAGLWVLFLAAGVSVSIKTFIMTMFIFAAAAAAGFVSIIPGGLGVNEISTIGLGQKLLGLGYSDALVATFAFRAVTLWFGIMLGVMSLVYLERVGGKE
jgi:uncharacterized protein (TIRG00374 family)